MALYVKTLGIEDLFHSLRTLGQSCSRVARPLVKPFRRSSPIQSKETHVLDQNALCIEYFDLCACLVLRALVYATKTTFSATSCKRRNIEGHKMVAGKTPSCASHSWSSSCRLLMEKDNRTDITRWQNYGLCLWADDGDDGVLYIASIEAKAIEQHIETCTLLLERGTNNKKRAGFTSQLCYSAFDKEIFYGLRIGTCTGLTSVIGISKYQSYCHTCYLEYVIWPSGYQIMKYIGEHTMMVEKVTIQPFRKFLVVVTGAYFLLVTEDAPTLLSVKHIPGNESDISLEVQYVSLKWYRYPPAVDKYLPTHLCSSNDVTYVLYMQSELELLHSVFKKPSVSI